MYYSSYPDVNLLGRSPLRRVNKVLKCICICICICICMFVVFFQLEYGLISQEETKTSLPSILSDIFVELNKNGKCTIQIGKIIFADLMSQILLTKAHSFQRFCVTKSDYVECNLE